MRILRKLGLGLFVILVIAAIGFFTFAPGIVENARNSVVEHDPYPVSAEAQALHDSLIVGDLHADPLLWNRDLSKRATFGHVDIPRLIEGNVAVQVFTAVTKSPSGQNYDNNSADAFDNITPLAIGQLWPIRTWGSLFERAVHQADKLHRVEKKVPDQFRILKSGADLDRLLADRAAGAKVVGGILGIEGAHALEGDIANLAKLEAEGYWLIGLHHFFDNALGGSLHGQSNAGLTDFGREVVTAVAERGLILDLAHSSTAVAWEVLELTDIPLMVSHTGVQAHCDVKRNFPDDLMKAIAETGGVIGLGYWSEVACGDITPDGIAKMTVTAVELLGEDHVALGSDFDGSVGTAFDTSELAALTHAMLARGLSEAQIAKVMGGNMMRVLKARLN